MTNRRRTSQIFRVCAAASAASMVLFGLIAAAPAQAATFTSETFTFSDPFGGDFSCDGFDATYSGHDRGTVTTWFNSNGDPVRQQGKIWSVETDTNLLTGKSVVVRSQLNVHVDFVTGKQSLTGIRFFSNVPGEGAVIQSVGNIVSNLDPFELLAVHGPADDIYNDGGFCNALAG